MTIVFLTECSQMRFVLEQYVRARGNILFIEPEDAIFNIQQKRDRHQEHTFYKLFQDKTISMLLHPQRPRMQHFARTLLRAGWVGVSVQLSSSELAQIVALVLD